MALTIDFTDLITTEDLDRDAVKGLGLSVTASGAHEQAAIKAIKAVSRQVERHLDRRLILRPYTWELFNRRKWTGTRNHPTYPLEAWAPEWPVVQVSTPAGVVAKDDPDAAEPGVRLAAQDFPTAALEVLAGYRRADQDQGALDTYLGEVDLVDVADVPVIPDDITLTVATLVLARLHQANRGTLGTGRRIQQVGSGNVVTVEAVDRDFVDRELGNLWPYKRGL